MMQSIVNNTGAPYTLYTDHAKASMNGSFVAGVSVIVGTDNNTNPLVAANPPFRISIHEE